MTNRPKAIGTAVNALPGLLDTAFFAVGAGCLASSYFAFIEAQEGARSRRILE